MKFSDFINRQIDEDAEFDINNKKFFDKGLDKEDLYEELDEDVDEDLDEDEFEDDEVDEDDDGLYEDDELDEEDDEIDEDDFEDDEIDEDDDDGLYEDDEIDENDEEFNEDFASNRCAVKRGVKKVNNVARRSIVRKGANVSDEELLNMNVDKMTPAQLRRWEKLMAQDDADNMHDPYGYAYTYGECSDAMNEEYSELKVVNLTPHDIVYRNGDVTEVFPGAGKEGSARVKCFAKRGNLSRQTKRLIDNGAIYDFTTTEYGEIVGLPPEEDGTIYLVSGLVASANKKLPYSKRRKDLYVPDDQQRNKAGLVTHCRSFTEGF